MRRRRKQPGKFELVAFAIEDVENERRNREMDNPIQYPWQQTIIDAFLALPSDVPVKIAIAEKAISTRLRDWGHVESSEHMALEDALRALRVLLAETKAEGKSEAA
jgi:hypothetical protein